MFIKKKDNERQIERKLQKAGALLGFTKHQVVTAEMVRKRFVELVKQYHPDNTDDAMDAMARGMTNRMPTLQGLREAKDFILKHMENDDG